MPDCTPHQLVIGDVVVQQDAHGRYSLNDLHRASGAELRHQPAQFLRLSSTRELIQELCRPDRSGDSHIAPVEALRGGQVQGTFVVKELVYDYAMWISASFRLLVIDAFDAMARGEVPGKQVPPDVLAFAAQPKSALLRLAADLAEENERQAAQLAEQQRQLEAQAPAVNLAEQYLSAAGYATLSDTARGLRLPQKEFFRWLLQDGVCFRQDAGGPLRPYSDFIAKGLLVFHQRVLRTPKPGHEDKPHVRGQTLVTRAGFAWLSKKYGARSVPRTPEQVPLLPAQSGRH